MLKTFSVASLLLVGQLLLGQAEFSSAANGDWTNVSTWTLISGSDEDGVPDLNDNVTIGNHTIMLSSTIECNNLTITTPTSNKLSLGDNNLNINGSISFGTIPTVDNYITSNVGTGKIRFVGATSRSLFTNGAAFGNQYELEIAVPFGVVISNSSNVKFRALYVTSGTLNINNSIRIDGGSDGNSNGKLIVEANGVLIASNSSSVIGARTTSTSTYCGSILVNGVLETSGSRINGQNVTINGILVLKNSNALVSDPSSAFDSEFSYDSDAIVEYRSTSLGRFGAETGRAASTADPILPQTTINVSSEVRSNSRPAKIKILSFESGKLLIENVDITIPSDGIIASYSSAKYVVSTSASGELIREGIGTINTIFPIGTASNYLPLEITNNGAIDNFRAFVTDMAPLPTCLTAATSASHTWNISEATPGGSDCTIALTRVNVGSQYDGATAKVVHCPTAGGPFDHSSGNGEVNNRVEGSGFTVFSPFGIGSTASPLPIKLTNLNVKLVKNKAHIYFTTISEVNMNKFVIEMSIDQRTWTPIGELSAAGISYTETNYTFIDEKPSLGKSYYRLANIDNEGIVIYSDAVSLFYNNSNVNIRNTVFDHTLSLLNNTDQTYSIDVFDVNGIRQFSHQNVLGNIDIDTQAFIPGLYFVQVNTLGKTSTFKLTKI